MPALRSAALVLTAALVFVWPIPHTVSVREILVLLFLCLAGYVVVARRGAVEFPRDLRMPVYLCLALALWMVGVAVFLSRETAWSLSEIQSQWGRSLLILALGVVAGGWMHESRRWETALFTAIFAALFVHVAYLDGYGVWHYLHVGHLPRRISGLAEGLDRASLGVWLAAVFLLAEIVQRLSGGRRRLPVHNAVLIVLAAGAFFASYLANSRNGMVVLFFLVILSAALVVRATQPNPKRRAAILLVGALVAVPALATIVVQADERWDTLIQTIPIAWDTTHHRSWLDTSEPLPVLPDGQQVDNSNYMRIAWFKEALVLTLQRPLGRGFGRQIFGHVLREKYGVKKPETHPHSGLMTLAIGAGIPGVVLWLAFCFYLVRLGYRRFVAAGPYAAPALILLTCGFLIATTLDSMMQDHMLQEFMFFTGLLGVTSTASPAALDRPGTR